MEETKTFPREWGGGRGVLRFISEAKLLHLKKVLLLVLVGQNQTQKRPVVWNITQKDLVSSPQRPRGWIVRVEGGNRQK